MDVLFVKSTVTNDADALVSSNILARVNNFLLPEAGGNGCFSFTFPPVTEPDFKVFYSSHVSDFKQPRMEFFPSFFYLRLS
jgi:hypothetical protein